MAPAGTLAEALSLHKNGQLDDAIPIYRQLIDRDPSDADAWYLLSTAAYQKGELSLARELMETALNLRSDAADYHNNMGLIARAEGDAAAAEKAFSDALALYPNHANALLNMTSLLRQSGNATVAVEFGERAAAAAPQDIEAQTNYGNALKDAGRLSDAIGVFRHILELSPDHARTHWNLALALLLSGDLVEGFAEYARRWRWDGFPSERRSFEQPLWTGDDLTGRTILLHAEQGLGDAVQFVRFAPLVAGQAKTKARVIVEVSEKLVPLFVDAGVADQVIAKGDPLPAFDVHAAFLDVPRIMGTTLDTVPAVESYLSVPPARREAWHQKLSAGEGLKVGINGAGNADNPAERARRLDLAAFSALGDVPDVTFYNLQKGPDAAELPPSPPTLCMVETGEDTLTETAAMMVNLDLVITSDTVIAHLAGSLGVPTWILLPHVPDWRWLMARDDSPWYPCARLFRQQTPGDWQSVAAAVTNALTEFAANKT
ncbi:MAG: tetratricopeptide repeat-containing glycosyltransferase family protein [Proteobacteria bacterium]|nr:tetratricopeptide repeat-containing glycosyltransferase family protein [Pseudomonadota bacterium]